MSEPTLNALAVAYIENLSEPGESAITFHFEPENGHLTLPDHGQRFLEWTYAQKDRFHYGPTISVNHALRVPGGFRDCDIGIALGKISYREIEALTTEICGLLGWQRVSAPFTSVDVCFNCDGTISESYHMRGGILHRDKAPEAPCKYQLCVTCTRHICDALIRRDKVQEALWNDSDETFRCECAACKKDGL